MQKPYLLLLESQLILILPCHLQTINLDVILFPTVASFAHLLLQPFYLFACEHLVVSLLHPLPKLLKFGFIIFANSLDVVFFSSQPDLVESK